MLEMAAENLLQSPSNLKMNRKMFLRPQKCEMSTQLKEGHTVNQKFCQVTADWGLYCTKGNNVWEFEMVCHGITEHYVM